MHMWAVSAPHKKVRDLLAVGVLCVAAAGLGGGFRRLATLVHLVHVLSHPCHTTINGPQPSTLRLLPFRHGRSTWAPHSPSRWAPPPPSTSWARARSARSSRLLPVVYVQTRADETAPQKETKRRDQDQDNSDSWHLSKIAPTLVFCVDFVYFGVFVRGLWVVRACVPLRESARRVVIAAAWLV